MYTKCTNRQINYIKIYAKSIVKTMDFYIIVITFICNKNLAQEEREYEKW